MYCVCGVYLGLLKKLQNCNKPSCTKLASKIVTLVVKPKGKGCIRRPKQRRDIEIGCEAVD